MKGLTASMFRADLSYPGVSIVSARYPAVGAYSYAVQPDSSAIHDTGFGALRGPLIDPIHGEEHHPEKQSSLPEVDGDPS
jgi:hypothetical protein